MELTQERLAALQAELIDRSYLEYSPEARRRQAEIQARALELSEQEISAQVERRVAKIKQRYEERLQRAKKLYYDAGRYVGGHTDKQAERAYQVTQGGAPL